MFRLLAVVFALTFCTEVVSAVLLAALASRMKCTGALGAPPCPSPSPFHLLENKQLKISASVPHPRGSRAFQLRAATALRGYWKYHF